MPTRRQRPLSSSFYARPALDVARDLLGAVLVIEEAGRRQAGKIVEVEAYVGPEDLACHASKGRTARTDVLFGPPGRAYVYLVYGLHELFNVVTGPEGHAAAVLIRGLEPLEGIAPGVRLDGPARLTRALGIDRTHNRLPLDRAPLYLLPGRQVPEAEVSRGPRIGVDYAGPWAQAPYRLWITGNPHVSRAPGRPAGPRRPVAT